MDEYIKDSCERIEAIPQMEEKDSPYHEVSNIFPLMDGDAFEDLKRDIQSHGQREPIWIDEQGAIIDGRNRYRACMALGLRPVSRVWQGGGSLVDFVVSLNLQRRHLDATQRAFVAVRVKQILEKEIAEQKREKGREAINRRWHGEPRDGGIGSRKIREPIQENPRHAAREAAKITGANDKYITQAEKIQRVAPEIAEKAHAGEIKMRDALRAVRDEERAAFDFTLDELKRKSVVEAGGSVAAHQGKDFALIAWAERSGELLKVDRTTEWGNPFVLDDDGTRDDVCDAYRKFYLPHKPSLMRKLESVKGKVLACWCYPERCHADEIIGEAGRSGKNRRR
jgi:hypothetical protein